MGLGSLNSDLSISEINRRYQFCLTPWYKRPTVCYIHRFRKPIKSLVTPHEKWDWVHDLLDTCMNDGAQTLQAAWQGWSFIKYWCTQDHTTQQGESSPAGYLRRRHCQTCFVRAFCHGEIKNAKHSVEFHSSESTRRRLYRYESGAPLVGSNKRNAGGNWQFWALCRQPRMHRPWNGRNFTWLMK